MKPSPDLIRAMRRAGKSEQAVASALQMSPTAWVGLKRSNSAICAASDASVPPDTERPQTMSQVVERSMQRQEMAARTDLGDKQKYIRERGEAPAAAEHALGIDNSRGTFKSEAKWKRWNEEPPTVSDERGTSIVNK